jgi:hypothetical protein
VIGKSYEKAKRMVGIAKTENGCLVDVGED